MTKYKPRGTYIKTNRDRWISTQWYDSKKDAEDFVKSNGSGRYKNIRIIKK